MLSAEARKPLPAVPTVPSEKPSPGPPSSPSFKPEVGWDGFTKSHYPKRADPFFLERLLTAFPFPLVVMTAQPESSGPGVRSPQ